MTEKIFIIVFGSIEQEPPGFLNDNPDFVCLGLF